MGGDLERITIKKQEGYFNKLRVSAIWLTPAVELVDGNTDESNSKVILKIDFDIALLKLEQ